MNIGRTLNLMLSILIISLPGCIPESTTNKSENEADSSLVREFGMDAFVEDAEPPSFDRNELRSHLHFRHQVSRNGAWWNVVVSVQVPEKGEPLRVVPRSFSDSMFIQPTIEAATSISYIPGQLHGHPIQMWVTYRIQPEPARN